MTTEPLNIDNATLKYILLTHVHSCYNMKLIGIVSPHSILGSNGLKFKKILAITCRIFWNNSHAHLNPKPPARHASMLPLHQLVTREWSMSMSVFNKACPIIFYLVMGQWSLLIWKKTNSLIHISFAWHLSLSQIWIQGSK